ncbi:hypothetical protein [Actinoplanes sp. URMC 104]|uniref:hypothetical protein n=1 Tax=Actinoplanes sp. URMC 104 TaxID=3423409 RepID=UPI003F1A692B
MERETWSAVVLLAFVPIAYGVSHACGVVVSRALERGGRFRSRSTAYLLGAVIFILAFVLSDLVGQAGFGWPEDDRSIGRSAARGALMVGFAVPCGALLTVLARALPSRSRTGPDLRANALMAVLCKAAARLVRAAGVLAPVGVWLIGVDNRWRAGAATAEGFDRVVVAYWASAVLQTLLVWVVALAFCAIGAAWLEGVSRQFAVPLRAPRDAVLYIRPFDEERRLFASDRTFEQFLGPSIDERLGPLVALGNPVDRVPPQGAARAYPRDEDWQEALIELARTARCIVAVTSSSPATTWEFRRIRELGLQTRLFLLSPPPGGPETTRPTRPMPWLRRFAGAYLGDDIGSLTRLVALRGLPNVWSPAATAPWSEFVDVLRSCGYRVGMEQPAPGAVLTFDDEATAVVLRAGAIGADDFLEPILRALRPGRLDAA